jgi:hypothetical protein
MVIFLHHELVVIIEYFVDAKHALSTAHSIGLLGLKL